MELGKEIRIKRLLNKESGNLLSVALDHPIAWGVLPGIENIQKTLDTIVEGKPDAITMHKGSAENCFSKYAGQVSLIMKSTTFAPYHPGYDVAVGYVEEALRLGADAIAVGVTVCGKDQAPLLAQLGKFVKEAKRYGLPVVSHIYPKGEMIKDSDRYKAEYVAYAARAAEELGVDIIKTFYTGDPESYSKVIEAAAPSIVVVSGGPKLDSMKKLFEMTKDAMDVGARGVTYGRNVWQAENPVAVLQGLKHIIHNQGTVEEALKILNRVSNK